MLIYRGDAPGMDGLREILGAMAQEFEQRMLLARWNDGEATSYMITIDNAQLAADPAYEPLIIALPSGVCLPFAAERA